MKMKIQLISLIVCVVATLALAQHKINDDEHQNEKDERQIDQASDNGNNKSIVTSTSSNEQTTENNRSSWIIRREQNAKQRHLFKHEEERPGRNNSNSYTRLRDHRILHIYDWQRKLDSPMPAVRFVGKTQHTYQHKHRTTTATITTSRTPLSEIEE